jgi:hypothetical protein
MCNNGDDDDDASQFLHKHHRVASPESRNFDHIFVRQNISKNPERPPLNGKDFSKKPLQRWEGLWLGRTEFCAARISQLQAGNAHPCHKINRHPQRERDTHILSNLYQTQERAWLPAGGGGGGGGGGVSLSLAWVPWNCRM